MPDPDLAREDIPIGVPLGRAVAAPPPRRPASGVSQVPYLPGLDGLRAIAVVAVMVYHAYNAWLPGGFIGVEVFFVISGYLITLLLIGEHDETGTIALKAFWARRARRLLPALYLMLLALTTYTAIAERDELGRLRGDLVAGLGYVSNWYQIWTAQGYTAMSEWAPLRHLWSLAVEEQFYVVWPLVMALLLRVGHRRLPNLSRWLVLAAIAIGVATALWYYRGPIGTPAETPDAFWRFVGRDFSKTDTLYLSTITRATGLLVGAALAMVWRPVAVLRGPMREKGWMLDALTVTVGMPAVGLMAWRLHLVTDEGADPWLFRGGFLAVAFASAILIAAVTHAGTLASRVFGNPVLRWIGTRSYGLYLFHWPIYQIIRKTAGSRLSLVEFAIAMGVTIVATEISYQVVEMPVRKRRLRGWLHRLQANRDPIPRRIVGVTAAVSIAVVGFAGVSIATSRLEPNEIASSITGGAAHTTPVLGGATTVPGQVATVTTVTTMVVDNVTGSTISTSNVTTSGVTTTEAVTGPVASEPAAPDGRGGTEAVAPPDSGGVIAGGVPESSDATADPAATDTTAEPEASDTPAESSIDTVASTIEETTVPTSPATSPRTTQGRRSSTSQRTSAPRPSTTVRTTTTSSTTTTTTTTTTSTTTTTTTSTTTSTTTTTTTSTTSTTVPGITPLAPLDTTAPARVVAIGDSVMLGAAENLAARGIYVDATVGRQMKGILPDVQAAAAAGTLGDVVVIHLGTNGSFSEETMTAMFDSLRGIPRVIVLNVHADRGWTQANNELLATLPGRYSNVTLIDWNTLVTTHCQGDCLYDDGIHLPPDGRRFYADLIFRTIPL